nr:hypothetical protein [uncultured Prevotella sp.]
MSGITVRLFGSTTFTSLLFLKHLSPNELNPSGRVNVSRPAYSKAASPIFFIVEGQTMVFNAEQLENHRDGISAHPSKKVTFSNAVQLIKPSHKSVLGNVASFIVLQFFRLMFAIVLAPKYSMLSIGELRS